MRPCTFLLLVFALLIASPIVSFAIEPGDGVLVIQDTPVRLDGQSAGIVELGTVVEVGSIDGLSVSIKKPQRGQINLQTVIPLSEAEAFFEDRLERDPNDAQMLALRGAMRYTLGKTDTGWRDLNEAIKLRINDGDLYYLRGKVMLAAEKLREANRDFKQACTKTQSARNFVAKGNLDLRVGDFRSAEIEFNNAKKDDPDYAPAHLGLAKIDLSKEKTREAIEKIDLAIAQAPYLLEAHTLRGTALLEQDQLAEAAAAFQRALQIDPSSIDSQLGQGWALFYDGKRPQADAAFDAAGEIVPPSLQDRIKRAKTYLRLRRFDAAITDLTIVVNKAPRSVDARQFRAQALGANGDYDLAIDDYETLFKQLSSDVNARILLWKQLARLNTRKKNFSEAEKLCNKIRDNSQRKSDAPLETASIRVAQRRYDDAIELYNQVIKIAPDGIAGHSGRAMTYGKKGDNEKMLEDFRHCASRVPDNSQINNNIAWTLATCPDEKIRDGAEAVKFAKLACASHKYRDPGTLDTLAAAYAEAGDFEQAVKWQKRATVLAVGDDMEEMQGRVELFEKRQPYREDSRDPLLESDADKAEQTPETEPTSAGASEGETDAGSDSGSDNGA